MADIECPVCRSALGIRETTAIVSGQDDDQIWTRREWMCRTCGAHVTLEART